MKSKFAVSESGKRGWHEAKIIRWFRGTVFILVTCIIHFERTTCPGGFGQQTESSVHTFRYYPWEPPSFGVGVATTWTKLSILRENCVEMLPIPNEMTVNTENSCLVHWIIFWNAFKDRAPNTRSLEMFLLATESDSMANILTRWKVSVFISRIIEMYLFYSSWTYREKFF